MRLLVEHLNVPGIPDCAGAEALHNLIERRGSMRAKPARLDQVQRLGSKHGNTHLQAPLGTSLGVIPEQDYEITP